MRLLTRCLLFLSYFGWIAAKERKYYIGIRETNWDYAPSGMNIISGKSIPDDEDARTFLLRGINRIGRVYKKAVYLQYTDDSYTEEIKKPNWLGFLGPIMKAEVGDTITIHLKNFATRSYGLHPHGVEYTKANEGALYPDNTSGAQKKDDAVKPGESYVYKWDAVKEQGPTEKEGDCLTRIYHSHVDGPKDTYSGLVGPLIICKKGVINGAKEKPYEFPLMFSVVDENLSWYLDENIKTYITNATLVDKENENENKAFEESNKMHSINGYMYGNLPGLSMCDKKEVHWHLFGMGNEADLHAAFFHGQVLKVQHHRVDTINLFPATMVGAVMVTNNPGKWLLSCQVNDHLEGGMQAIYEVRKCSAEAKKKSDGPTNERHYYIAAEEITWNYGPTGINQFTGQKLDQPDSVSAKYFEMNENRIGGSYKKAVYVGYTDGTFTKQKERHPDEAHLGILGPIISAQVGDVLKITFKNNAFRPYSIQAHGVSYTKDMEGAVYKTSKITRGLEDVPSLASHVTPGETFTYEWAVPENVGPSDDDLNCLPWLYFSSVDAIKDTNSGLVGPLLVCRSLSDNTERGVDKNFYLMATVFDENKSWYLDENIEIFTKSLLNVSKEDGAFKESNMMHSINGYMYGNQPGLEMCKGISVMWHMMGLGNEVDMHGIHFTGNTIENHKGRKETANLFPHSSYSVVMHPDNEGVFDLECMTTDHFTGGMKQHYRVKSCGWWRPETTYFRINTYYIAAEEVEWDYSPNRTWEHEMYHDQSPGDVFLNKSETFIGSKYKKAVYRQYTDGTFRKCKERQEDEKHLGILGPLITANVGEKIKIVFKNKASRPYSIYAHGVKTESNSVMPTGPGDTQTYIWKVPERSGPLKDSSCITWAYYSKVDQVKDTYSGLIGPLVICEKSSFSLRINKAKKLQFALLFMVFNENESWYMDENIKTYTEQPDKVDKGNEEFIESNTMHGINGKMYANLQGLTMRVGDQMTWHLIGMGNEVDIHTVHFHAHSFDYKRGEIYRSDVFDLFPGTFQTVEMTAKVPGTWLLHCHVTDHIHAGMETTYTVLEN